jgi:hypothetical protein
MAKRVRRARDWRLSALERVSQTRSQDAATQRHRPVRGGTRCWDEIMTMTDGFGPSSDICGPASGFELCRIRMGVV